MTLPQLFSCEFCQIFKNTIFYRTPLVVASESLKTPFPKQNAGSQDYQIEKQYIISFCGISYLQFEQGHENLSSGGW